LGTVCAVGCELCHAGPYFDMYLESGHAMVGTVELDPVTGELAGGTANAEPIADGPGCAGCHSGNYDPKKHVPDVNGVYPWANTAGDDAFSEPFIGCSACHRGLPTAHTVPKANLANADICGQCHSRYSNSVVQYENYDGTTSTQQYTLGDFNPLGDAAGGWSPLPIADFLNVPTPMTGDFQQMYFYTDPDGNILPWSARGHAEGAQQYNEWAAQWEEPDGSIHIEAHANAIPDLIASGHASASCLECHSADYRMAEEGEKPTLSEAKYGITCQVCHNPHAPGEQTSLWNEERNPQLVAPREELCVECHTAEIPEGTSATPGSALHHPMKEMMAGTGAIGVPQGTPSVHKDKCVDCHMVPTSYDRNGVPMTGANHTFAIVEPEVAAESLSTSNIGGIKRPLPYSSCSECHGRSSDPYATYLTGVFENRQAQMQAWDAEAGAELTAAAGRLGYASTSAAVSALNKKGQADWNASELAFQSAYTNRTFIESEGSWGIHNWAYAREVILKALDQARSVKSAVTDVMITSPLVATPYGTGALIYGQSTTISGNVVLPEGADTATLLGGQVRLWFKPAGGGTYQPVQQVFLSGLAFDEYSFTVMPARNGTYQTQFIGNEGWDAKVSTQYIGLDVKYRTTISRPKTNVKLNTSVKFKGTVMPVDFTAGTKVQIQRKKGTGAWKNWTKVGVGVNGVYSFSKKMTATGTYRFRAVFSADADHLQGISNTVKIVVKR